MYPHPASSKILKTHTHTHVHTLPVAISFFNFFFPLIDNIYQSLSKVK